VTKVGGGRRGGGGMRERGERWRERRGVRGKGGGGGEGKEREREGGKHLDVCN